jgi:hypothetical protein
MRWFKIRQMLRDRKDAPAGPAQDAFWTDFRARARMTPQEAPGTPHPVPLRWIPEWTVAAVCALLLLGMGWYFAFPGAGGDMPPNKVHSLRVSVPYAALLMTYDPASKATIVWVDGMNMDDENDGV